MDLLLNFRGNVEPMVNIPSKRLHNEPNTNEKSDDFGASYSEQQFSEGQFEPEVAQDESRFLSDELSGNSAPPTQLGMGDLVAVAIGQLSQIHATKGPITTPDLNQSDTLKPDTAVVAPAVVNLKSKVSVLPIAISSDTSSSGPPGPIQSVDVDIGQPDEPAELELARPKSPVPSQTIAKGTDGLGKPVANEIGTIATELKNGAQIVEYADESFLLSQIVGAGKNAPQLTVVNSVNQIGVASVIPQIVVAIKSENHTDVVEVRLDPPELGRVKIDFTMESGNAVKAMITAEHRETLDHLRKNSSELAEQLKQSGFKSVSLEFSEHSSSKYENPNYLEIFDQRADAADPDQKKNTVYLSMHTGAALDLLV